jgi:hypothetical protein
VPAQLDTEAGDGDVVRAIRATQRLNFDPLIS